MPFDASRWYSAAGIRPPRPAMRRDAKRHGRSLNAEILDLLTDEARLALRRLEMKRHLPELRKLREEIARKHPTRLDCTALIREDRDSR